MTAPRRWALARLRAPRASPPVFGAGCRPRPRPTHARPSPPQRSSPSWCAMAPPAQWPSCVMALLRNGSAPPRPPLAADLRHQRRRVPHHLGCAMPCRQFHRARRSLPPAASPPSAASPVHSNPDSNPEAEAVTPVGLQGAMATSTPGPATTTSRGSRSTLRSPSSRCTPPTAVSTASTASTAAAARALNPTAYGAAILSSSLTVVGATTHTAVPRRARWRAGRRRWAATTRRPRPAAVRQLQGERALRGACSSKRQL